MSKRENMITDNLGLVHSCCHRFTGRGIEYDDLYQAGCMGLVKAADGFDESRGLCFSTYAVPVILGEIRRLFRDGGAVKVSRSLKELSMKVMREREKAAKALGRDPTVGEIAERLGVTAEDVAQAICAGQQPMSLTWENDEKSSVLDIPAPDTQDCLTDNIALEQVVSRLDTNDRELIRLRYFEERTQAVTAEALGMTQVQVSRREKIILNEMRALLAK